MSLIFNGGVVQGRISLNRFVDITSTAAAKIFRLFPKKEQLPLDRMPILLSSIQSQDNNFRQNTSHERRLQLL